MWNTPPIILASESPRRHEILEQLHIEHTIVPPYIDESCDLQEPQDIVCTIAEKKALTIQKSYADSHLIIAADTLVAIKTSPTHHSILGKPQSLEEAHGMLAQLCNKSHKVYTGLCITHGKYTRVEYAVAEVFFKHMTSNEIQWYLNSKEWRGVAGGYGIQGLAACFIQSIKGDYSTIMGLPIPLLYDMMKVYITL